MKNKENYYLGLDIGTDSVGYAVTNDQYDLLKFKGEPMWGVHLFEEGNPSDKRRAYRTARRRLDRRQQRVKLVQNIFAGEIANVDPNFYRRIKESALWREDAHDAHCLFDSPDYTDADYHRQYPTIHHLICDLIDDPSPHDVRLVYLACAWLVAHRGHFLNELPKDNLDEVLDIHQVYSRLMEYFTDTTPWECDPEAFGIVLKKKLNTTAKYRELCKLLFNSPKAPKSVPAEEEAYYNTELILKLLCGGKVAPKSLFVKEEYAEVQSFSLDCDDETLAQKMGELGDDGELISLLKAVFDWALLADILDGEKLISRKKIALYEQHKQDLAVLKRMVKRYVPDKYNATFRGDSAPYSVYAKSGKASDFCSYISKLFKNVKPVSEDSADFNDIISKAESVQLCPKQVTSDNRVIPYQVYYSELNRILENAKNYLPFLTQKDQDGYAPLDKILSIMEFRIPYFVGPLNRKSDFSWMERIDGASGKIYPWNFNEIVDLDKSEQAFIDRMTNTCSYLPYADVLPKCSLLYEKFQVLNEINTLTVNGQRIPVCVKQDIYLKLFCTKKKVTVNSIKKHLLINNYYTEDDLATLGGIDETIKSSLTSTVAFRNLLSSGQLTEAEVEEIIKRSTYTEDRTRFSKWIDSTFSRLSAEDRKYISRLKFTDFGRLSKELLCDIYPTEADPETGEVVSIIERMWNENLNLMEILSDRFTYNKQILDERNRHYQNRPETLDERMKSMYLSNSVKRSLIRTLDVVSDVVKATGSAPKKIFLEMARGGKPEEKGKRTKSRYEQLTELYAQIDTEDVRKLREELESMGADRERKLQSDRLFLYYLQFGKSMYSDTPIELSRLSDNMYDIDHIYPQSKVKDDSLLNNKVLVLSSENGAKGDIYPISENIRHSQHGRWKTLLENRLITAEKYKRLTRHTPFDENEEWGFINRQLVETRQSTKAAAALLQEKYPASEIVYVKAGMVSEFRQKFDMFKCRSVNDLHHAKDAYLNIIVGNVYNGQFTKEWYLVNRSKYNLKVETLFTRQITVKNKLLWNGTESLQKVKNTVQNKNSVHMTRYAFCRKGELFDVQPKSPEEGTIPRKKELTTKKYGGYRRATASFYVLARYTSGKKSEVMLVPVELMKAEAFTRNRDSAICYVTGMITAITGKPVESIDFPLGLRQIKINTMIDAGGLRMCLAGKSNGGRSVIPSLNTPLIVSYSWEKYIKHLERFSQKKAEHPNMVYSEEYDKVTTSQNIALYDLLVDKLSKPPFAKRPNNPETTLKNGRDKFIGSDIFEQSDCLMQVLTLFGRTSGGCNLLTVGGDKKAAAMSSFSASLSNWKKYSDVRIIDQSASGLFESRSDNLLELL